MRYAVFADIHSNLEAWQAVFGALKQERIDQFICVGDIVGYGADPRKCTNLIEALKPLTVAGNHDQAVVGKLDISYFNINAREAILWTKEKLAQANRDYLASLELVQNRDDFILVHGSLDNPEEFKYILDIDSAGPSLELLEKSKKTILFVAHSHRPFVLVEKGNYLPGEFLKLPGDLNYIINVGSVGQPRDGDWRACYALYDSEKNTIEFKRIKYDVETTRKKIIKAGLPRILADRLMIGR